MGFWGSFGAGVDGTENLDSIGTVQPLASLYTNYAILAASTQLAARLYNTPNMEAVCTSETVMSSYKNVRCHTWQYHKLKTASHGDVKTLEENRLLVFDAERMTTMTMMMIVILVIAGSSPCPYICTRLHGVTTQKTAIFTIAFVITSFSPDGAPRLFLSKSFQIR